MIQLEGIYKSFYTKRVLEDISFTANSGRILGLLGPNGAGKTTLIRIMNGIIEQDKGYVTSNGKPLTSKEFAKMGYLPEERGLYRSMTVEDHAVFLARLRGLTKKDAQKRLSFWLEKFEIDDWRSKRIEELSKGMAQKIQFICTVLHDPDWIVLDEPFSGFDPVNAELIRNELYELRNQGKTILLSTHNMKSVEEICDDVVMIHQGKKCLEGKVSALKEERKQGEYAITFKGNMLVLANALWTGFELLGKKELGENLFEAHIKLRGENTFNDLLHILIANLELVSATEILPSMEDIFIQEVMQGKETSHA